VKLYPCSTLIATTTSGTGGVYTFTNVTPGTYTVKLTTPHPGGRRHPAGSRD
jgi:hypothetical protein